VVDKNYYLNSDPNVLFLRLKAIRVRPSHSFIDYLTDLKCWF